MYFENEKARKQYEFDLENTNYCNLGIEAEHKGDIDKAIEIYELLLKRKFEGTHPYRQLCEIYHKQGQYKKELQVINALRKVTPKWKYQEGNKFRWYDKRYAEITSKK